MQNLALRKDDLDFKILMLINSILQDDKVSTKDGKKRVKSVTSANLGKSLAVRMGSWGAYLKSIRVSI